MKLLGFILAACVTLAVIKAAVTALLIVVLIGGVWALIVRPQEVIRFVLLFGTSGLIERHPLYSLGCSFWCSS